ncbi:hypothetical protein LTSEJOH_2820 [Salmonella enterica subsp. enterica serovar Johannesburg str. S5-703]|nr:hypothetical protein LTSEJOH_2820 [Salmonella enterica subsp. enterica serovar Johannesburg str. S5-703]
MAGRQFAGIRDTDPRLNANLQAKISRSAAPLENALAHVKTIIATPEL